MLQLRVDDADRVIPVSNAISALALVAYDIKLAGVPIAGPVGHLHPQLDAHGVRDASIARHDTMGEHGAIGAGDRVVIKADVLHVHGVTLLFN